MAEAKQSIVGIAIPEECGKAEKYGITAIMYHDDNSDKTNHFFGTSTG